MSFSLIGTKRNILLIPFSWLYQAGVFFFSSLYDLKIFKSRRPEIKTICVGNLSVGGTGKSPMVEYLVGTLQSRFAVAVLSRGYKRKTVGFVVAETGTTVQDIGDEPMQFHQKFPNVVVAVDEERIEGVDLLVKQNPGLNVIILDDAYQHRAITAGLNILLTEYSNIFTKDWYLPAGSLRDLKINYKRADIIVVTKTRKDLSQEERQQVVRNIKPFAHQEIFFTTISYGTPYNIFDYEMCNLAAAEAVVLVTGIANPKPLLDYLDRFGLKVQHLQFSDHHHFNQKDIGDILGTYQAQDIKNKIILTTEKDAVRLRSWRQLKNLPVWALPIKHRFLFEQGDAFDERVKGYVAG
ncbi:MAG: tetraacyldisaccharide 4'-kinase [Niabella sp.]